MTGLSKFLNVVATLMFLVVGGALLANNLKLVDLQGFISGTESPTGLIGGAMLLLGIIVIFVGIKNARPEQAISIQNPEGEVRISFTAIEELLAKASQDIRGIRELKPKIIGTKRGIEVLNRATIEAGVSIPDLTARIQEVVKSQLRGVLGIEEIGLIRTYVNKIITEESGKEHD